MTELAGIVEAHYLLCPYCGDRADLESHRCMGCGALADHVAWDARDVSSEMAMVMRTDNMGIGRRRFV